MTTTDEDIFRVAQAYLDAHPEIVEAMRMLEWYAWAERQLHPVRIIEQRYEGGQLVSERDVTPTDLEPTR